MIGVEWNDLPVAKRSFGMIAKRACNVAPITNHVDESSVWKRTEEVTQTNDVFRRLLNPSLLSRLRRLFIEETRCELDSTL
jgi:hypothetical protein